MRNSQIGALPDAPDRMAAVGVGHDVAVAATSLTFQEIYVRQKGKWMQTNYQETPIN